MLASDWQNPLFNLDVSDDGHVSPIDALLVINAINSSIGSSTSPLDLSQPVGNNPYFDINGDQFLSAIDVLLVINQLNNAAQLVEPSLALQHDTGVSASDRITNDLGLTGAIANANSQAIAKVRIDRGPVIEIPVDAQGGFAAAKDLFNGTVDGIHSVTVFADNGNLRKGLKRISVTLDTAAPAVRSPVIIELDDTGYKSDDGVTKISTPRISASSEIGSRLSISVDDETFFNGLVTAAIVVQSPALSDGRHQLRATVTDVAGNVSISAANEIVIDTVLPVGLSIDLAPSSDSGVGGDRVTRYAHVTLQGQTEANSFVAMSGTSDSIRSSGDGLYRFPNVALLVGANTISLTATDLAGNQSQGQQTLVRQSEENSVQPVLEWNLAILNAIQRDATAPPIATRNMAMMSIAVYDAINAIEKTPGFLVQLTAPATISTEAAVSAAAHGIMRYLYPGQQTAIDQTHSAVVSGVPDGLARSNGLAFGKLVADAVIALRANDGWDRFVDYVPQAGVGDWVPTAPMYDVAQLPQWDDLQPFAVTDVDSLVPNGPPDLSSQAYADALNEVKSLGAASSASRTVEQTQIARFWADGSGTYTPPGHWGLIASQLAADYGLSLGETARLFAILNTALGDASIVAWKAKYKYQLWRPITAANRAADDGNPLTSADPSWRPLLITPSHPEYVSGHSTYSAAAAQVLGSFFGNEVPFSTTSLGLPGVTRTFTSFAQAAAEAGRSRIYGGIHYEFSNQDGQATGRSVADAALARFSLSDDLRAPTVVFESSPTQLVTSQNPSLSGWAIDNLSGVAGATIRLDDGPVNSLALDANGKFTFMPNLALDGTADGMHSVYVSATDKAGIASQEFVSTFLLDTRVPTVSLTSPLEDVSVTTGQLISGTSSGTGSNLVSLSYKVDGGAAVNVSFNPTGGNFSTTLGLSNLEVGTHTLTVTARDASGLVGSAATTFRLDSLVPLSVNRYAPLSGASEVGSTFRPQVFFSRAVDKSTLTPQSFFATDPSGNNLATTIVPSQDGTFAWLFLTNPMPGSSTITVHVDGGLIKGLDGALLDADGDTAPGGQLTYSFSTVSLSSLPNTSLIGRIVDPGSDLKAMTQDDIRAGADGVLHTADDIFLLPIAGAKVYVLGREDQFVLTDASGAFQLTNLPSGSVKLAIDGRSAMNAPSNVFFPEMVMDLELVVGSVNTAMGTMGSREERAANLDRPEIYLPRLQSTILRPISDTTPTTIGVDSQSSPNLTDVQRANLKLEVLPNSVLGTNGQPLSNAQVGISTVPPELVRDMLPPGLLQHTFDITIQAPEAVVFSTPLQMTFPNVFDAAPGTKLNFLSFDHTTGRLVIEGTATVSADGLSATTDYGNGITKPGWHGLTPPGTPIYPPCNSIDPVTLDVAPIPVTAGVKDYFFSTDDGQFTISIANNAKAPHGPDKACQSAGTRPTPLVVHIEIDDVATEFLEGVSSHTFNLSPGQTTEITVSLKDLIKNLPQVVRDRMYGAKIHITGYKYGKPEQLLIDQSMNVYRYFDISDASHTDGLLQLRDTVVDSEIQAHPNTLQYVRSLFEKYHADITGVTVITHGYQPPVLGNGDSLLDLASAIHEAAFRASGHQGWLLNFDAASASSEATFNGNKTTLPSHSGESGELVLLFDWAIESHQKSNGWGEAAGDALFSVLVGLGVVNTSHPLMSKPLHFIGHSFGTAVTSEAVRRVLATGTSVDQVTYLDPHDFDQQLSGVDTNQQLYSLAQPTGYGVAAWQGVGFTDVYYETRGAGNLVVSDVPTGRPIPGAYNVFLDSEHELPALPKVIYYDPPLGNGPPIPVYDHPFNYVIGDSDHSYVWSQFYMATVTGVAPTELMEATDFSEYAATGWNAFSRIANGSISRAKAVRPSPTFFNTPAEPSMQDHRWSSERIVDKTSGMAHNASDELAWTYGKQSPTWDPLQITNGHLENDPTKLEAGMIPGWFGHGGGGSGNIESTDSQVFLQLDAFDSERTHNWFYVPPTAATIGFSMKRIDTSDDDLLQVKMDNVAIGEPISLSTIDSGFHEAAIPIPPAMRGQVHTITFEVVNPGLIIDSVVQIDDVQLITSGSVEPDTNIAAHRNIDFLLGSAPRPTFTLANGSPAFSLSPTNAIVFDPKDVSQIGSKQVNGVDVRSAVDNSLMGTMLVSGMPIAQRRGADSGQVGPILAVYADTAPGTTSTEFLLGKAGSFISRKFFLQNLGDQELKIDQVSISGSSHFRIAGANPHAISLAPNQKLPIAIEYAGTASVSESARLVITELVGDKGYSSSYQDHLVSLWVDGNEQQSGNGEPPANTVLTGNPLSYGDDYVLIDFPSARGIPPIRLRSDDSGSFSAFLPANEPIHFAVFDPVSGLVSESYSRSSASGVTTHLLTPFFAASSTKDSDADGIPNDIERIIGTSASLVDTNGDGISDLAAIKQGLDPLAGRPVATGVLGNTRLFGEAKQLVVSQSKAHASSQTAFVATGSYGLAIVDVSQLSKPVTRAQIDLPGDAVDVAFDQSSSLVAVATGSGGLIVIDASQLENPVVARTIPATASAVEIFNGVAYVAVGAALESYDLLTGELIERATFGLNSITALAREGTMLYTADIKYTLRAIDISGTGMNPKGSLSLPIQNGGSLFVGNGIAYIGGGSEASFAAGFITVDVGNPDDLTVISGVDAGGIQGQSMAANGSGLAVSVGSLRGQAGQILNTLDVIDIRDPAETNNFLTRFDLPNAPKSVAIAGGIAYVADGAGGLVVVNYLAFDTTGIAPTIGLSIDSSIDNSSTEPGVQALEGSSVPVTVQANDDVQVRSVELLLNGQVVQSAVSFPFNLSAITPTLPEGALTGDFTIQARATDTGGNTTLSDPVIVQIRPDTIPPTIDRFDLSLQDVDPTAEGIQVLGGTAIHARFGASDLGGLSSVELLLNGVVVQVQERRSGFLSFTIPQINPGETSRAVSLQLRAVDRAGNESFGPTRSFAIIPDRTAPKIAAINLREGDIKPLGVFWLNVEFDKPMDATTLAESNFVIVGPGGVHEAANSVGLIGENAVSLHYEFSVSGEYTLTIDRSRILDRAANPVGATPLVITFASQIKNGPLFPSKKPSVGLAPSFVTVADVNNDDRADLITTNFGSNDVSVLLANGDGTFAAQQRFAVGNNPYGVTVGDVNSDGRPDLIAADYGSNAVSLLLGTGDGKFEVQRQVSVGTSPDSVTLGDVNSDGHVDVITSNFNSSDVSVLLGNGDGTFAVQQRYSVGSNPYSVTTVDLNGDGRLDLITANSQSNSVSVLLGKGDGTFAAEQHFKTGIHPMSVVASDVNGDGRVDLITANTNSSDVSVLFGMGDGSFEAEQRFAVGSNPHSVTVGDVNGDGRPDLISADYASEAVSVLLGKSGGKFEERLQFGLGAAPSCVTVGDVDGDGHVDVITAVWDEDDASEDVVSLLFGNGDATFADLPRISVGLVPNLIISVDVNSDGQADLVTANTSNDVSVLLGNGDGTFSPQQRFSAGIVPQSVVASDVNGDGRVDLITGSYATSKVSVLLGNGDGTFSAESQIQVGVLPRSVSAADVNGDGRMDLITANIGSHDLSLLLGNGDGTFAAEQRLTLSDSPFFITTSDVNGDGRADLITSDGRSEVSVLLGNGDGTFLTQTPIDTGMLPQCVTVADVNVDGRMDLITANAGSHDLSVLLGNGDGTFAPQQRFHVGQSPYSVTVGDVNGDGRPDLIAANADGNDVSVLLGKGDGTFDVQERYAVGMSPRSVTTIDTNGDGKLDLATANGDSHDVSVLINLL